MAFEADAFGVGMRVYQKKTTSCSIGEKVYNSYIVNIHVEHRGGGSRSEKRKKEDDDVLRRPSSYVEKIYLCFW